MAPQPTVPAPSFTYVRLEIHTSQQRQSRPGLALVQSPLVHCGHSHVRSKHCVANCVAVTRRRPCMAWHGMAWPCNRSRAAPATLQSEAASQALSGYADSVACVSPPYHRRVCRRDRARVRECARIRNRTADRPARLCRRLAALLAQQALPFARVHARGAEPWKCKWNHTGSLGCAHGTVWRVLFVRRSLSSSSSPSARLSPTWRLLTWPSTAPCRPSPTYSARPRTHARTHARTHTPSLARSLSGAAAMMLPREPRGSAGMACGCTRLRSSPRGLAGARYFIPRVL